jgi:hypothetical protein
LYDEFFRGINIRRAAFSPDFTKTKIQIDNFFDGLNNLNELQTLIDIAVNMRF